MFYVQRPVAPVHEFILKVHSRCDLACDYCYVYTMRDTSWRAQPRIMARETVDRCASRIAEHAQAHALTRLDLILHGGEPLLAGPETLAYCVDRVRAAAGRAVSVRATVQTNGVRLDRSFLESFRERGVRVGVSLDGARTAHDLHRRDRRGRGSHARVTHALTHLRTPRYRRQYAGLLCVIDLRNDPLEVFEALLAHEPPAIDLLLPHGSWSAPPPGRETGSPEAPYGRWLAVIFDRWYRRDTPAPRTSVRIFEEVIRLLLGGPSRYEGLGLGVPSAAVVGTNGELQLSDHLAATSGHAATGMSVHTHTFDDLLGTPPARARHAGLAGLCSTCRSCRLAQICGGGLPSHRFRAPGSIDNPSVYCPDLAYLIDHVRTAVAADLAGLRREHA